MACWSAYSPLVARIQASGVLRNPPIVTLLRDDSQRFIMLDGENWITALRKNRTYNNNAIRYAVGHRSPASDPP
jgi:hypothetical protein